MCVFFHRQELGLVMYNLMSKLKVNFTPRGNKSLKKMQVLFQFNILYQRRHMNYLNDHHYTNSHRTGFELAFKCINIISLLEDKPSSFTQIGMSPSVHNQKVFGMFPIL